MGVRVPGWVRAGQRPGAPCPHRWHQTSVRVFFPRGEECVNEFPRVSRLKLFSYAVAALSNLLTAVSAHHSPPDPPARINRVTKRRGL